MYTLHWPHAIHSGNPGTVLLCGQDGRQRIRLGAQDRGLCIREMLQARDVGNGTIVIDNNWVGAEMPRHVNHFVTSKHAPVLVTDLIHLADTVQIPWLQEGVVQLADVLIPQAHSEPMDMRAWGTLVGQMEGLICTNCNFRVSSTIQ